ncbi:MAG: methionyl-tRNA formyltransferase [Chitinispirillaceae bacterium]|nr:methionyl-tRNA formyltransferase [Chitinispirillaceae bacterium]
MRIVFMGTAEFGIKPLQSLIKNYKVVGVVSAPLKPAGRGLKLYESPIVKFAKYEKIEPVYTPENLDDPIFLQNLKDLNADCFVVVAFRLLPRSVFTIPSFGTLNIHASLLPAYRGPAPIQRAIEAGETKTGVTIFKIDDGIDTGDILLQQETEIFPEETSVELSGRLSEIGAKLICEAIEALKKGTIVPFKQRGKDSKAPKLKKSEGKIDWKLSATTIFNKIRAFKPFPGTFTYCKGKKLDIEWGKPLINEIKSGFSPGTIVKVDKEYFDVQTGEGLFRVLSVKPEGRVSMPVTAYLHGTKMVEGFKFDE